MTEKEEKKEPIKVTDRRSFTLDGQRRASEPETAAAPPPGETVRGVGFELRPGSQQRPHRPLPAVEFNSFILSLATTAFIHLGELEDPVTGKTEINTEGARQMIEILDMLHAKTKGNLDAPEDEFLTGILCELKLKFARKASQS